MFHPRTFGILTIRLVTARRLGWDSGTDNGFWIHVAQAIVFTVLAVWAFQRVARMNIQDGPSRAKRVVS